MKPRLFPGGGSSSEWLLLLLLFAGVLIPACCVLWFMGEAARSQAEASRRGVADAYRGQLLLLSERLDADWRRRVAELNGMAAGPAASRFAEAVSRGIADSIVLLDDAGRPAYPAPLPPLRSDALETNPEWTRGRNLERDSHLTEAAIAYADLARHATVADTTARAYQAQIRCLLRGNRKEEAIRVIVQHFHDIPGGRDLHNRIIAGDEQLLALHLLRRDDARFLPVARRLVTMLNDYGNNVMPSAQRLFLMDELLLFAPDPGSGLPTRPAESMAAQFLAAERSPQGEPVLQRARAEGLWKLTASNGRAVALYRADTVTRAAQQILNTQNSSQPVLFSLNPPGSHASTQAIPAGDLLPGWRISFAQKEGAAGDAALHAQAASYLWAGYLTIAGIVVTGLLTGHSLIRQWRRTRLKTDLVAAVSHELKTPLSAIRLLVDSLREDGHSNRERVSDYLGLISVENARLTRLIDNLLTFSRIERSRHAFDFVNTDPARVTAAAMEAMGERLHAPVCRFAATVHHGLPAIHGDEGALVSVLVNLLDNAFKYSPGEKHIELEARHDEGYVVFEVRDRGIGIAARHRRQIFRSFYQVDRRLSRETGGCGLGLSIVAYIVGAHGGTVEVSSEPGAGSTFKVVLPAAAKGAEVCSTAAS